MTDPEGGAVGMVATSPYTTRRRLLTTGGRIAAGGALAAVAACGGSEESPLTDTPTPSGTVTPTPTSTPTLTPVSDTDMLVLMIQLHYLQAEFYSRAVLGLPLAASLVAGMGALGDVVGARTVTFADPVLADVMREVAIEKVDQVVALRAVLAGATPARPTINIGVDDAGTFTKYGRDANDVPAATAGSVRGTYDVYANQERFLLGAFILEDAVMAAWRGVSALMTGNANIDVAAGLLTVSAQHVGIVRNELTVRGSVAGSTLYQSSNRLSDLRDSYSPVDDDQGVSTSGTGVNAVANINPTDDEGEIFGRLPQHTINVFYMTRMITTSGGFFPSGLNGALRTSLAT